MESLSSVKEEIPKNTKSPKDPPKKPNRFFVFINSKKVVPYLFVSPFILSFALLTLYPAIQGIIMSFQRVLPGQVTFVGLSNYERLLNPVFFRALTNTTLYVIFTVLILTIIPIFLAIFLDSKFVRFKTLFRAALFIPALTSTIVGGMIFRLMFAEQDTAVANQLIGLFGIDPLQWRYTGWAAIFLMVMLASWRWMGVNLLYFLAALQNVPEELYEAADIDGASTWKKMWYITIPQMKPIIIFVSTISIIGGFRMFEESFVFWESGSPGNIGLSVVGYIYQEGIRQNDLGYGSAIGVILMLIIAVISIIYLIATGAFKRGDNQ